MLHTALKGMNIQKRIRNYRAVNDGVGFVIIYNKEPTQQENWRRNRCQRAEFMY